MADRVIGLQKKTSELLSPSLGVCEQAGQVFRSSSFASEQRWHLPADATDASQQRWQEAGPDRGGRKHC